MTSSILLRWLLALLALLAIYPASFFFKRSPPLLRAALLAAGFLPFVGLSHVTINLLFEPSYRGDARGLELTALDFLLPALFFASPRLPDRPVPYRRTLALYFLVALASCAFAPVPLYALFGLWKLARMCLVVVFVWRVCGELKAATLVLKGLHLGVIYEALVVAWQHWGQHKFQSRGNFNHPNSLTMTCNLIAPIALALLLSGAKSPLAPWTLLGALACMLFGLSRGSLIMFALLVVLVYFGSLYLGTNRRKLAIGAIGFVLALGVGIKALPSILSRFETASAASGDARERFKSAARMMISDHPFGVGINQFAEVMEHQHYSERVGIPAHSMDSGATVHNIYYLTTAELGFLGIAVYLVFLSLPLGLALSGTRRGGNSTLGHVLLGCAVSLTVVYLQGTLEWLSRQTTFSYVFFMLITLIAAFHSEVVKRPRATA